MTLSIMPSPAIHLHTTLAQSMAVVFVCVPNTFSNHFINWPLWSCREDRGGGLLVDESFIFGVSVLCH